jgi:hypothetical protein
LLESIDAPATTAPSGLVMRIGRSERSLVANRRRSPRSRIEIGLMVVWDASNLDLDVLGMVPT